MAGSGKQSRPQLNENNDQENVNNSPRNRQSRGGGLRRQKAIWTGQETKPFLDDFDVGRQIGNAGQFGLVYRCRRKSDRKKLAVKTINKARFYRLGQNSQERFQLLSSMQGEINILQVIKDRHPSIINVESVYEDRHFLYIVMQECKGGDLMDRLQEKIKQQKLYSEPDAAKIIHSICSAIYYMYTFHEFVHCNLKPENVLFLTKRSNSAIKMVDFGMSQVIPKLCELVRFVGTPYYTAPEILEGKHGHGSDMWSIGAIMFLMLFGFPPFYVDKHKYYGYQEQQAIYALIKKGFTPEIKRGYGSWFPEKIPVSDDARDLMTKLLMYDKNQRIVARDVLEHPWIKNLGNTKSSSSEPPTLSQAMSNKFQKLESDHRSKMAFAQSFRELFTEMKPKHFQSLRKVLSDIDKSNTGKIMFSELKSGMIEFIQINKDLIQANLKVDTIFSDHLSQVNDNGAVIRDDLINVATNDYIIDREENLYATFRELDKDNDRLISTKKLKVPFAQSQTYGRVKDIEKIIEESKLAANGKIDYELFLNKLRATDDNKPKWFHLALNADNYNDDEKENGQKNNLEQSGKLANEKIELIFNCLENAREIESVCKDKFLFENPICKMIELNGKENKSIVEILQQVPSGSVTWDTGNDKYSFKKKCRKIATLLWATFQRFSSLFDLLTDAYLLYLISSAKILLFSVILSVSLVCPYIVSYSCGIKIFLINNGWKATIGTNYVGLKKFLMYVGMSPVGVLGFVFVDFFDILFTFYKLIEITLLGKTEFEMKKVEETVANQLGMTRMDYQGIKRQRGVTMLIFETIPQSFLQLSLLLTASGANNGDSENVIDKANINHLSVYTSIVFAMLNSLFRITRLYLEAQAVDEPFYQYCLECLMARIAWVPFKNKIGKYLSQNGNDHEICYKIKYPLPFGISKIIDYKPQVDFDFSSLTLDELIAVFKLPQKLAGGESQNDTTANAVGNGRLRINFGHSLRLLSFDDLMRLFEACFSCNICVHGFDSSKLGQLLSNSIDIMRQRDVQEHLHDASRLNIYSFCSIFDKKLFLPTEPESIVLECLIDKGFDMNAINSATGETIVFDLIRANDVKNLELVIKKFVTEQKHRLMINYHNNGGISPLFLAIQTYLQDPSNKTTDQEEKIDSTGKLEVKKHTYQVLLESIVTDGF